MSEVIVLEEGTLRKIIEGADTGVQLVESLQKVQDKGGKEIVAVTTVCQLLHAIKTADPALAEFDRLQLILKTMKVAMYVEPRFADNIIELQYENKADMMREMITFVGVIHRK